MLGIVAAAIVAFTVAPGIARTPLSIESGDGVSLHAIEYRSDMEQHRRTLVLIGDGTEGSSSTLIDNLAEALFLSGLDVVTWDRRGTGHSDGLWDFGQSDEQDLLAITASITSRTFGHEVGLVGIGTGGVAAVKVFHKTATVKALAIYGVGTLGVPDSASGAWKQVSRPESFTGRWLLKLRGVRVAPGTAPADDPAPDLARIIGKVGRRPVLIGAGGHDRRVPQEDIQDFFRSALPPKEWVFAPSADDIPPVSELAPRFEDFFRRRLK